jgi:hypothetical protein
MLLLREGGAHLLDGAHMQLGNAGFADAHLAGDVLLRLASQLAAHDAQISLVAR